MLSLQQSGPLREQDGFTVIEILVTVALIAILTVMAIPVFQHWVQNAQIRNGAEGILNGLQQARTEAVRRNAKIEFVLVNQTGWTIALASAPNNPLTSRDPGEGSSNASTAFTPTDSHRVTFTGMGWVTTNGNSKPPVSSIDVTSATMTGTEVRPLRIVISTNGSAKMCDPSPSLAAGDPRICP
jgi:type IV fimbrial biogenesis protein FimT